MMYAQAGRFPGRHFQQAANNRTRADHRRVGASNFTWGLGPQAAAARRARFASYALFPNVRWCLIVSATNRRYSSHSPASAASSDTAKAAVAGLLSVATMFSA